jgi:hypothetical protein
MPWGWIVFATPPAGSSTSSNPGLPSDPHELETFVKDTVTNAGATFYGLYFEVGSPLCHVVVKDLDVYEDAKAVMDILHAKSYRKLLDPTQTVDARGRVPHIRPKRRASPSKKRTPKRS